MQVKLLFLDDSLMQMYRVPVVAKGLGVVGHLHGKSLGDCIGGLACDAEVEVSANLPYLPGARRVDFSVELAVPARQIGR